jgi:O-antigen/teichoic acid export membrane protein
VTPALSTRGLVRQSLTYGIAGALAKALALLSIPYLSRALGPSDYGLADLATSLAGLLTLIVNFSGDIPAARLRARATSGSERRQVLGTYVLATAAVSVVAAGLLIPMAQTISTGLWGVPAGTPLAVAAVALVPVSAVQVALAAIQRLEARPGMFAVLSVIDLVAQLALAVAFVALGLGPFGVVLGFITGSIVGLSAAAISARRYASFAPRWSDVSYLLITGVKFLPAIVGFVLADQIARVVAAHALSIRDVGYLGVAIRLSSVISLAATAFSLAWGPLAMSLQGTLGTARLFGRVALEYAIVMISGAILLGALAPEVAIAISGEPFRSASIVMPGLALSAGLAGGVFIFGTVAGASERTQVIAFPVVVGGAVQIVSTFLLVPAFQLSGIGIAAVLGPLLSCVLLAVRLRHSVTAEWLRLGGVVLAGVALVIWLQIANTSPEETQGARYLLAFATAALGTAGIFASIASRDGGR